MVAIMADQFNVSFYRLPELELRHRMVMWDGAFAAAVDSAGVVYVNTQSGISMLEISDTGTVTILGKLTGCGKLETHSYVAAGPQPGQLCVGPWLDPILYIVDIATYSIINTVGLPVTIEAVRSLAADASGKILISDSGGNLAMYGSVYDPPILLTDTPVTGRDVVLLGHKNQFMVGVKEGSDLYVLDGEGIWHTVDALSGEDGVGITDIAVWGECVWVASHHASLHLLCPE